jgi:excisionase family DNA binding protein
MSVSNIHPIPMLVGARDACERLSISARTLFRLTVEGAIPSRKIGRLRRYDPRELDAWIARGCPPAPHASQATRPKP